MMLHWWLYNLHWGLSHSMSWEFSSNHLLIVVFILCRDFHNSYKVKPALYQCFFTLIKRWFHGVIIPWGVTLLIGTPGIGTAQLTFGMRRPLRISGIFRAWFFVASWRMKNMGFWWYLWFTRCFPRKNLLRKGFCMILPTKWQSVLGRLSVTPCSQRIVINSSPSVFESFSSLGRSWAGKLVDFLHCYKWG